MQPGHAAGPCSKDMQQGHAAGTRSRDMQQGHAAGACSRNTEQGHAARTCSRGMQQGHGAGACSSVTTPRVHCQLVQYELSLPHVPWRFFFFSLLPIGLVILHSGLSSLLFRTVIRKPFKISYLAYNISCWISKWINDVLHFCLTACLLVQVSQAVIDKVASARKNTISENSL